MINVPIPICTAQLQARSDLCFISLIKSLNLNFAGLLEYYAAPQLEAQVLHARSQRAQRCWLGLVLLVSRHLIMAAAIRVKLTRSS